MKYDVVIIGGGLAGLVNAIGLGRAGLAVLLIEKKQYPFHRVCGEYISNETLPFLHALGIDPHELGASRINRLQVTAPDGRATLDMPLDLGGFGLSRYRFDHHLFNLATAAGVAALTGKSAEDVRSKGADGFEIALSDGTTVSGSLVIGAFGKRSKMDKQLDREFIRHRSPYLGVKYHVRARFPKDLIALHNFRDGYCGVCAIEDDAYNVCYLTTRDNLKKYGTLEELEENTLYRNPFMRDLRRDMAFLHDKPEVINEVSFAPKKAVEDGILMSGDTAGLITPLCGNGMAMAIHSAKILSELVIQYHREGRSRAWLEENYARQWQQVFARRLWMGRHIQSLFGNESVTSLALRLIRSVKPAARYMVRQTHGKPF
jgi:flavin-dependent dehydrogenase